MRLTTPRPTGVPATEATPTAKGRAARQATALAELSVADAEARLVLDWASPLRHATFYKAVYRPAVLRANRLTPTAALLAGLRFHSLRHTYASLCGSGAISFRQVAEWMGHANPTTTEHIYTHIYKKSDHADEMAALGALATPNPTFGNVIPLHG